MKTLLGTIISILAIATSAQANIHCAGETYSGTVVQVEYNTVGSMGYPNGGRVTIESATESYTYAITREDTSQFYEAVMGDNDEKIIVGLNAYIDTNYHVGIQYHGKNYETNLPEDLIKVLKNPARKKQKGNFMRVYKNKPWDDSKYENNFYDFRDVVCNAYLDA